MLVDPRLILASLFRFTWRYLRWPSLHLGFNLEFCRSQHAFLSSNITIYIILAEPRLALAWLRLSFCFTSDVLARLPIRVCKICALMHYLRSVRVLEVFRIFRIRVLMRALRNLVAIALGLPGLPRAFLFRKPKAIPGERPEPYRKAGPS